MCFHYKWTSKWAWGRAQPPLLECGETVIIHVLFTVTCCCQTLKREAEGFLLVRRNCSKEHARELEEGGEGSNLFIQRKKVLIKCPSLETQPLWPYISWWFMTPRTFMSGPKHPKVKPFPGLQGHTVWDQWSVSDYPAQAIETNTRAVGDRWTETAGYLPPLDPSSPVSLLLWQKLLLTRVSPSLPVSDSQTLPCLSSTG